MIAERLNINQEIRARELRVIGAGGENLGVLPISEALGAAKAVGLDLIEISPQAMPPVAKIADYGKFEYERGKKERAMRARQPRSSET
ncbi:MAG: translation initiation factor IF-3, partial [bacterium]|nr:translation initiation factor IF-3 [bacterium]